MNRKTLGPPWCLLGLGLRFLPVDPTRWQMSGGKVVELKPLVGCDGFPRLAQESCCAGMNSLLADRGGEFICVSRKIARPSCQLLNLSGILHRLERASQLGLNERHGLVANVDSVHTPVGCGRD